MKLLMIVVDDEKKEELEVFLNRAGVAGYTEIPRVLGVGASEPRLGSRAFPKSSAILFTIIEEGAAESLVHDLRTFCKECGERLRIVSWGVGQEL